MGSISDTPCYRLTKNLPRKSMKFKVLSYIYIYNMCAIIKKKTHLESVVLIDDLPPLHLFSATTIIALLGSPRLQSRTHNSTRTDSPHTTINRTGRAGLQFSSRHRRLVSTITFLSCYYTIYVVWNTTAACCM